MGLDLANCDPEIRAAVFELLEQRAQEQRREVLMAKLKAGRR